MTSVDGHVLRTIYKSLYKLINTLEIRVSQKLAKLMGEAHRMSGMEGGKRIGVNCVAWEVGFQHWL